MNYDGIIIGIGTFLIIGLLHPVVIKAEYYFTTKIWPLFLIFGLLCFAISLVSPSSRNGPCQRFLAVLFYGV